MKPPEEKRWAMVLAAGLGSRLKQFTADKPKALVEIGGKTLLEHVLENLKRNGFTDVVVNVHHFAEKVIEALNSQSYGLNIIVSDERRQLMDTGGAILQAAKYLPMNELVMAHNVDLLHNINLAWLRERFIASEADAGLVISTRESSRKLLFDDRQQLIGWKNGLTGSIKRVQGRRLSKSTTAYAFSGIHFFYPSLFANHKIKPCSVIDIYLQLAATKRIAGMPYSVGWWFDVGKAESVSAIENEFSRLIKL